MKKSSDLKFEKINEYIFAPFNTFIYLDDDEIGFTGSSLIQNKLIEELNKEPLQIKNQNLKVEWGIEESEEFKLSKGVFSPPGKEISFVIAQLVDKTLEDSCFPIKEKVSELFPENSLKFSDVRFYFHDCGVGTCSVRVKLETSDRITILQLEEVSEALNNLYKQYFEDICFQLTRQYIQAVRKLNIPHHNFGFLPDINEVEKSIHFIPWTHRLYHIEDDSLFELENPGEPFKFLLTPSRQMDVKDLSIYDNRYVYFGWGHLRLVEIAQAKWQFLDVLTDIVDFAIASFNRHHKDMQMKELQTAIDEIRNFENAIDSILDYFRGVKITFDTEKRLLLRELHERWLTDQMLEKLQERVKLIQEVLNELYQRQKEQRDESLNTIALLFTIVGIIEVFAVVFDILSSSYEINPILELIIIGTGTLIMALLILIYIRYSERG